MRAARTAAALSGSVVELTRRDVLRELDVRRAEVTYEWRLHKGEFGPEAWLDFVGPREEGVIYPPLATMTPTATCDGYHYLDLDNGEMPDESDEEPLHICNISVFIKQLQDFDAFTKGHPEIAKRWWHDSTPDTQSSVPPE
jgi:hypothetical protein